LLPEDVPKGFGKVWPLLESESMWGKKLARGQNIDLEYERIPIGSQEQYLKYFNQLVPVKTIRDIIEEKVKEFTRYTIGVHIRRGDYMHGEYSYREMPITSFINIMDRQIKNNAKTDFFLTTDCSATEALFKKKYKKKLFTYKKQSFSRQEKKGLHDALVDLLLLSKTSYIIGSYLSTFTEVAWWFGQCKAKVDIINKKQK